MNHTKKFMFITFAILLTFSINSLRAMTAHVFEARPEPAKPGRLTQAQKTPIERHLAERFEKQKIEQRAEQQKAIESAKRAEAWAKKGQLEREAVIKTQEAQQARENQITSIKSNLSKISGGYIPELGIVDFIDSMTRRKPEAQKSSGASRESLDLSNSSSSKPSSNNQSGPSISSRNNPDGSTTKISVETTTHSQTGVKGINTREVTTMSEVGGFTGSIVETFENLATNKISTSKAIYEKGKVTQELKDGKPIEGIKKYEGGVTIEYKDGRMVNKTMEPSNNAKAPALEKDLSSKNTTHEKALDIAVDATQFIQEAMNKNLTVNEILTFIERDMVRELPDNYSQETHDYDIARGQKAIELLQEPQKLIDIMIQDSNKRIESMTTHEQKSLEIARLRSEVDKIIQKYKSEQNLNLKDAKIQDYTERTKTIDIDAENFVSRYLESSNPQELLDMFEQNLNQIRDDAYPQNAKDYNNAFYQKAIELLKNPKKLIDMIIQDSNKKMENMTHEQKSEEIARASQAINAIAIQFGLHQIEAEYFLATRDSGGQRQGFTIVDTLKQRSPGTLANLLISSPFRSSAEHPVGKYQVWSAITSNMADAVGLTAAKEAYAKTPTEEVINTEINTIQTWGARQLASISTNATFAKAQVDNMMKTTGKMLSNLAENVGIKRNNKTSSTLINDFKMPTDTELINEEFTNL